ncbi:DUF427 domain-containing protein [Blastococcus sp. CT_GayMR19]|uniref:DUF427 domain-containing protein n=1 Tax=Blastococcus sp. CT_GayMR19 TaxID=2559608 RepID=UPI001ADD7EBD|nr:DUF427 domain-containing protein [Blastococcus sp. CT_GayMR19]
MSAPSTSHRGIEVVLADRPGMQLWWPSVEPTARWIRVRLGGELVADSRRAVLHLTYGPGALPRSFLPTYYVPVEDVRPGVLVDGQLDDSGTTTWAVAAGGRRVEGGAWMHRSPPPPLEALTGMVTFSWRRLDWFEEDEPLMAHARDPHTRVDVAPSSRHVRVELDGHLLAESTRPTLLFETTLPVRYYLPREDVVAELSPTSTHTICPYKGVASWWSVRVGERVVEDLVWSYPTPIAENPRIAGLMCFYNEKVDLVVDGERQERPVTPWS